MLAALSVIAGCTSKAQSSQRSLEHIKLSAIESPILIEGDERHAFRDPAAVYFEGVFYLYYTFVEIEGDGKIYSYTAMSKSRDLVNWTDRKIITPKGQKLNYCSPGNVIRFNDEWVLCLQTYPRDGYTRDQIPRYGDGTARVFVMTSEDLENWSAPRLLKVKGPDVPVEKMGRMIDAFLLEDKDEAGKWWCFYKQNGVSMSYSRDLVEWTYFGRANSGENVCVLIEDDSYLMFHSPSNGIGVKKSKDLRNWTDVGELITLDQKNWPWAKGRLTAGFVLDMTEHAQIGKYIMFFHGSGPHPERIHFDNNASIGIAWSDDLNTWDWPGKD
jgi:sucrose-6-phosphate hydrolase SacC (GH32 family)